MRVLIVYRHELLRDQVADLLTTAGLEVATHVKGPEEIGAKARSWKPDVILLDIQYAATALQDLLKDLKQTLPKTRWVIAGPEPHDFYARHFAALGADLYLSEAQRPQEWLREICAMAPSGNESKPRSD